MAKDIKKMFKEMSRLEFVLFVLFFPYSIPVLVYIKRKRGEK